MFLRPMGYWSGRKWGYDEYRDPFVMLEIAGQPAYDVIHHMEKFTYDDEQKKVDKATFQLTDPEGIFLDDPRFEPDTVWTFRFGYAADMSKKYSMKVKFYDPDFDDKGQIGITVTLMGKGSELVSTRIGTNWGKIKTSEIAKKIAARHGLKWDVEDSKDKPTQSHVQPHTLSDWAYLNLLADFIGFEVDVKTDEKGQDVLTYKSRNALLSESPRAVFIWGGDDPTLLKSFKPSVKVTKAGKVKGLASSTKTGKAESKTVSNKDVKGTKLGNSLPTRKSPVDPGSAPQADGTYRSAVGPDGEPNDGIVRSVKYAARWDVTGEGKMLDWQIKEGAHATVTAMPEASKKEAAKAAEAAKGHLLDGMVAADATFIGSPRIESKTTWQFTNIGKRMSGLWHTTDVKHTIGNNVYETHASLKRGAYNASPKAKSKDKAKAADTSSSGIVANVKFKVVHSADTGEATKIDVAGGK